MKKLLALLLAAVMCLSLAACGGTDTGSNNEPQTIESDTQQENEDNAAENNEAAAPVVQEDNEQQTSEDNTPNIVEIELTTENFDTYFEFIEVPVFSENAFGEAERLELEQYYLVKEEYSVSDISDFAVEFEYSRGFRVCDVDYSNRAYVLGDFTTTPETYSKTNDRWNSIEIDGQERFGFFVGGINAMTADSSGNETGYGFDYKILRVTGTLFLIEE